MTKPNHRKTTDTLRQALATLAALMDRTINEVNVLESEIQDGVRNAVQDAQLEGTVGTREDAVAWLKEHFPQGM